MDKTAEIINVLSYADKYTLIKLWSQEAPLDERIKFIKYVLTVRLNKSVNGWETMDYNLRFQVICNRIVKELNLIV